MKNKYDIIVIGSGPGGEGAAMQASKAGKSVAVIDGLPQVGGNCTHKGTIPSKALRHAVQLLADTDKFREGNYLNLLKSAESVIQHQVKLRRGFYERNLVDIIHGHASFLNERTIEVTLPGVLKEKTSLLDTAHKDINPLGSAIYKCRYCAHLPNKFVKHNSQLPADR